MSGRYKQIDETTDSIELSKVICSLHHTLKSYVAALRGQTEKVESDNRTLRHNRK
ncbi:MAG: hypothetical protein LBE18_07905 [Planctomycetaceae bacterium]|nr:hypothetical protein [Planctomycetaceae bacterium]